MTNKEKQALNKKIAKWCEFIHLDYVKGRFYSWESPTGEKVCDINFCDSMDALIKWVIEPNQGFLNDHPKGILDWKMARREPNVGTYPMPRVWLEYEYLLPDGKNFSE
jgi:hypothetical protein